MAGTGPHAVFNRSFGVAVADVHLRDALRQRFRDGIGLGQRSHKTAPLFMRCEICSEGIRAEFSICIAHAIDVGEEDEAIGAQSDGARHGRLVGVDVVYLTVVAHREARHDRQNATPEERLPEPRIRPRDFSDKAPILAVLSDKLLRHQATCVNPRISPPPERRPYRNEASNW